MVMWLELLGEEQRDHQIRADEHSDDESNDVIGAHAASTYSASSTSSSVVSTRTTSSSPMMRVQPRTYATATAKNAITTATKITSFIAPRSCSLLFCSCPRQHAAHLVGDGNPDDARLERRADAGAGGHHEATDLTAVAQHREL